MKELSIEQKAKAYDEALSKAKEQYNYPCMRSCMGILEEIFPELKELNGEKIRKALIEHFKFNVQQILYDFSNKDVLAWLEKQGGHANFRNKIQVGDKVTRNEAGVLVNLSQLDRVAKKNEKQCKQKFEMKTAEESLGIDSDTYNKIVDECIFGEQEPEGNKGNIGGISANWSEEDDKVRTTIINEFEQCSEWCCANGLTKEDCIDWLQSLKGRVQLKQEWSEDDSLYYDDICEILMNLLHSERTNINKAAVQKDLDWLGHIKESLNDMAKEITKNKETAMSFLKSCGIMNANGELADEYKIEQDERKSAEWSEEDEKMINGLINSLTRISLNTRTDSTSPNYTFYKEIDWLKSLKGRVQPKQEWNEEDECYMTECINAIATKDSWSFEEKRKTKHWVKSLKQRIGG